MDDLSYDIVNLIFEIEKEYYERRHEANKDKPNYNNEFLIDTSYKFTIIPKLEAMLGRDWIKADFSSDEVYSKIKAEFKGIAGPDMEQIGNIAAKSGVNSLTDMQKTALAVL